MIIQSLLDTDLYKFTMMQLAWHHFPNVKVKYGFKCRTENINFLPLVQKIQEEINYFCTLQLKAEEIDYLKTLGYFKEDFLKFLSQFKLSANCVQINNIGEFDIIIEGTWVETILFEVPILAIISQLYSQSLDPVPNYQVGREKLLTKIDLVKEKTPPHEFNFIEFGTRRRFSFDWQREVIETLQNNLPNNLSGTSNVLFAKQYNLKPMGTMAHEYVQAFQALAPDILSSEKVALQFWLKEYDQKLSIALSDTYNTHVFLNHFDAMLSNAYQGVRQDSGDPFIFGDLLIEHYKKFNISPITKTIVFSDALNFNLAIDLFWYFHNRIKTVFGIGTNLTNDLSRSPIQIVIKMIECNGKPVAKLSDSVTKTVCRDPAYLAYLKKLFKQFD